MTPETRRRLVLTLGAAVLALGGAVAVQSVLVQENVVSRVTEAYGVVVGVCLALPLALEVIQPSDGEPTATRYGAAAAAVVGAAVPGAVAAQLVLFSSLGSPVPAAVGATFAYAGGRAARSYVLPGVEGVPGPAEVPEADPEQ